MRDVFSIRVSKYLANMNCKFCNQSCYKWGKQKNGTQKLYCRNCKKYQQQEYKYAACNSKIDKQIANLVCESVSIRGIARILKIALATVIKKIKQKARTNVQTTVAVTQLTYDDLGRLVKTEKKISNTKVNGGSMPSGWKTVSTNEYDALGQLKKKKLGTDPNNPPAPLDSLVYDYNIRGWMLGANRDYAKSTGSTTHWFGFDLGYDKTTISGLGNYAQGAFNDNITGMVWKSKGDAEVRKYDFTYDALNRLTGADFNQYTSGAFNKSALVDFSISGLSYDANGNILAMNQMGWKVGGSVMIDSLLYTYYSSSNKLKNVIDGKNDTATRLGDFRSSALYMNTLGGTKTSAATDYSYDPNGNLNLDNNKDISNIHYNYLNLPSIITVTNKGTITYTYDAAGNKIRKSVQETNATVNYNGNNYLSDITTVTTYIGGFVYQSKTYSNSNLTSLNLTESLLYLTHEEGRARIVYPLYGQSAYFAFDYFIRDHLGNIRMTITDEQQQDTYPAATLETGAVTTEQKYYNIINDLNHIIPTANLPWYSNVSGGTYQNNNGIPVPPDPTINPSGISANVYKLNGATGDRFGLGIILKVMAGDALSIFGRSFWHSNGQTTDNSNYGLSNVLTSFINAFAGTSAVSSGSHGTANGSILNGNSNTTVPLNNWLTTGVPTPSGQTPKAYINWIFFDEQFKPLQSGNGFDPINTNADGVKPHSITGIPVPKSGYVYIYCSDESNQDVYFDNLQVIINRGQLLEERHYYPDGLNMFAISSRAFGKLQTNLGYQGKDLQNAEFYDGSGLEEYDFGARFYDQQLGRWWVQDPANQFASPYIGMGDNWGNGVDPNGKNFWRTAASLAMGIIPFLADSWYYHSFNSDKWDKNWWKTAIAADIITASFAIGVGEIVAPAATTAVLGGTATANIAFSTSIGVLQSSASQLVQDGKWDPDNQFGATLSGAISGVFQSNTVQGSIDKFLGIGENSFFKGIVSNDIGSILATSIKDLSTGSWSLNNLQIGDISSNVFSTTAGQFFNNLSQFRGDNLIKDNSDKHNWVSGKKYPQIRCDHFFLLNSIYRLVTNSAASISQQFFTGNIFSPYPLNGAFDFSSFSSNFFPNLVGGWLNDMFAPN